MTFEVPKYIGPALAADAHEVDGVATAVFRGTADIEAKPDLDDFVKRVHEQAIAHNIKKVVADFRELKFMNSSSFKVFVTWLALVQALPAESQYRIHFKSNPNLHWQRRSLAALSCFAVDLVAIET